MNRSEKYTCRLNIEIVHEYYVNTLPPVILTPTAETVALLKKQNILFRNTANGSCAFLIESGFSFDDGYKLRIELRPSDHKFYYVSQSVSVHEFINVYDSDLPNVWKIMEIDTEKINSDNINDLKINIETFEKYYEYICIPKYCNDDIKVKLTDEKTEIKTEKISLPGIQSAFRFITKDKIKLSQNNTVIKMHLWETKEYGDRLISSAVPNPLHTEISVIDPKNTLTTYFYF